MGNLAFLKVETTGLEPDAMILELALVVTTPDLKTELCEESWLIDYGDIAPDILAGLNPKCFEIHEKNGLLGELMDPGSVKFTLESVTQMLRLKLRTHLCIECGGPSGPYRSPLCGLAPTFDRSFLATWMPDVERELSYLSVDCQAFADLVSRWAPLKPAAGLGVKRALPGVHEAIALLRRAREAMAGRPTTASPIVVGAVMSAADYAAKVGP